MARRPGWPAKLVSEASKVRTLHQQAPASSAAASCAASEWCGGVFHPLDYTQLAARTGQSMAALLACGPQHSLGCRHASFSGRQLNVRPMPRVRNDVTGPASSCGCCRDMLYCAL